ncbi:nucleotidyltransferase family protein [Flavobacterium sp. XS1P32]|uniref:nucleotidyltransferase family protein n=1 Tax=Flavobacterium sp. XS1P32 TaxID=3401726 RepID=UPI003AB05365
MKLIDDNKEKLNDLCVLHHVKQLYFFGSIFTKNFKTDSDIDMLVQFDTMDLAIYFDNYMDFKEKAELLFNRPIDLVENQAIKNPIFRKVVDREKQLIYG